MAWSAAFATKAAAEKARAPLTGAKAKTAAATLAAALNKNAEFTGIEVASVADPVLKEPAAPEAPKAVACTKGETWSKSGMGPCVKCATCTKTGEMVVSVCVPTRDVLCEIVISAASSPLLSHLTAMAMAVLCGLKLAHTGI